MEAREGGGFGWGQGGGVGRKCRQLQLNNKIIFKKELKKGILRILYIYLFIFNYFIIVQVQLSAFLPTIPPHPRQTHLPPLLPPSPLVLSMCLL